MSKGDHPGEFELLVLAALEHLRNDAYAVSIANEIEARAGREASVGAVYATLARLSAKGFVAFRTSEPQPVRGGRARKYVAITAAGRRALRDSTRALGRMVRGLGLELDPKGGGQ